MNNNSLILPSRTVFRKKILKWLAAQLDDRKVLSLLPCCVDYYLG